MLCIYIGRWCFRRNMKLEPQDDGYETAADMMLANNAATVNHEVKCEKMDDPYSFIDDDPVSMMPSGQGPHGMMSGVQPLSQMMQGPKKRGRKKKIKPDQ